MTKSANVLVGWHFHKIEEGRVTWQGYVVGEAGSGLYLCQLLSWMDGCETNAVLVHIESMKGWLFYEDYEAMRHSWEYGTARVYRLEEIDE